MQLLSRTAFIYFSKNIVYKLPSTGKGKGYLTQYCKSIVTYNASLFETVPIVYGTIRYIRRVLSLPPARWRSIYRRRHMSSLYRLHYISPTKFSFLRRKYRDRREENSTTEKAKEKSTRRRPNSSDRSEYNLAVVPTFPSFFLNIVRRTMRRCIFVLLAQLEAMIPHDL